MLKVMFGAAVIAALLMAIIVVTHILASITPLWLVTAALVAVMSTVIGYNL